MNVRNLLTVNAVYTALVALVSIFLADAIQDFNGVADITDETTNQARLVGATAVGYCVTSWLMRNAGPSVARRAFLMGGGVGWLVVALVFVFNWFNTDGAGAVIWLYIITAALLGVAFLYLGNKESAAE